MTVADLAGWVGALTLLAAYRANVTGRIAADGTHYRLMNMAGSVGLGTVALAHHTWPSLTVNALWLAISARTGSGLGRSGRSGVPERSKPDGAVSRSVGCAGRAGGSTRSATGRPHPN